MTALQTMYNEGKLNVVQSVGYENPNFSHFRATDIWNSGDTTENRSERVKTGWMGRYLEMNIPVILMRIPMMKCLIRWLYRSAMCLH